MFLHNFIISTIPATASSFASLAGHPSNANVYQLLSYTMPLTRPHTLYRCVLECCLKYFSASEAVYQQFCKDVIVSEILEGNVSYRFADLHAALEMFMEQNESTSSIPTM